MNAIDREPFLEIVMGFAELKGKTLSAPALELYWNAMQAWSLDDFKAAAAHLLSTCEFMPTPKDFEGLRKARRMTAGEAFAKAIGWARNGGYKAAAKTPEAILIDRVVATLGGWSVLANHDTEKLHFLEQRFVERYETIEDATDTRAALPQLAKPDWLQLGADDGPSITQRIKGLAMLKRIESEIEP